MDSKQATRTALLVALLAAPGNAVLWHRIGPGERCAARAVVDAAHNRAVMFGGTTVYTNGAYLADLWAMTLDNPRTYEWKRLPTGGTPPPGRADHLMVYDSTGGRIILFGGSPARYVHLADVWSLALDEGVEAWQELHPTGVPPGARGYAYGIHHPGRNSVIIFGGYSTDHGEYGDVWELDLDSLTWRELHPAGTTPSTRYDGAAFYDPTGDRMLVFAGRHGSTFVNELWSLSLTSGAEEWTRLSPSGQSPSGRIGFASAADESRFFVCAGWNGSTFYNDLYALDIPSLSWTYLGGGIDAPAERRNTLGLLDAEHGFFLVFGGEAYYSGNYVADTYFADIANVALGDVSSGRQTHTWLAVDALGGGRARITIRLPEPDDATVSIIDCDGRVTCDLYSGRVPVGSIDLIWNGTDDAGRSVPSGCYYALLTSRAIRQSGKIVLSK